jgi:hypothetical protein
LLCSNVRAVVVTFVAIWARYPARTKLDDIDYDAFYRINEQMARHLVVSMMQCAGERWPQSLGTVIEIGAGTGGATMGLATLSAFQHLVVTDISLKMLGLACVNVIWREPVYCAGMI